MAFLSAEIIRGVVADRPVSASAGRLFFSSDEGVIYRDDGSSWIAITIAASQVTNLIASIQQEAYTAADDTGTANAYAVALSPVPSVGAYSFVVFKAAHANTGASTLAVNGGSAIPIKKSGTLALASGDILAGQIITVVHDGTNFQLIGALRALVAADIPAIPESGVTSLVSDLALKAPLASPTFTGTPAAPTPLTADSSATLATTAFVHAAVAASSLVKYTTSWSAQTSVTVTHGLSTTAVIVQVFDAGGVLVIPESVTVTSSSVVTLTFGAAFTGSVVVIG